MRRMIVLLLMLLLSGSIVAATRYWEGDVDSDWNNANNWDGDILPSTGDAVIIDVELYTIAPIIGTASSFSPASVTLDDSNIGSLPNFAELTINADLTVTGHITTENRSNLNMQGGTITIGHDLQALSGSNIVIATTVTQTNSIEDITIGDGGASVTVQSGANITGFDDIDFVDTTSDQASFVQTGGSITILDDIMMDNGTGDLLQITGGTFSVGDNVRVEQDNNTIEFSGSSTIQIDGAFRLGPAGGPAIDGTTVTIGGDANVAIDEVLRLYGGGAGSSFNIEDNAYVDVATDIDDPELINLAKSATLLENGVDLPVVLLSFDAIMEDNQIIIRWSTAAEINNDYFELYHSNNANENYNKIGTIRGAGFSNEVLNYSLVDTNYNSGINYYRLRQVDFDGESVWFPIISIDPFAIISNESFSIYPNPVKRGNPLYIRLNPQEKLQATQNLYFAFLNLNGTNSSVREIESSASLLKFETSKLRPGTYILSIRLDNKTSYRQVVVK